MTESTPSDAREAFEAHDAFEQRAESYHIDTTVFEGSVTASEAEADWALSYTVQIIVPTLTAAVDGDVGPAIAGGWLDTFERRLEDAPKSTRANVELDEFGVESDGEEVVVEYGFTLGSATQAADVAKTFVEYVEGTYVEGVVPGYDYQPPVSKLLDSARSGGADGKRGGTPL